MKTMIKLSCWLVLLAVLGTLGFKVIGAFSTSPYWWEGRLRLPEGAVTQVEIRSNPIWGDPQFQRTSTNSVAAAQLIGIVNRGVGQDFHWCSCIATIKLSYANGRQITFGYCPGHVPAEYDIVKVSESAEGKVIQHTFSTVPRAQFFAVMRALNIDDSVTGLALPNSTVEMCEYRRKLNSSP